jgi:hypothetical protein
MISKRLNHIIMHSNINIYVYTNTDQLVPNCSWESLSICALDTEGDGAPVVDIDGGPCNDSASSDGIIRPEVASSNVSLVFKRCISFVIDTIELLVVAVARRSEDGVVVTDPGLIVKPRDAE